MLITAEVPAPAHDVGLIFFSAASIFTFSAFDSFVSGPASIASVASWQTIFVRLGRSSFDGPNRSVRSNYSCAMAERNSPRGRLASPFFIVSSVFAESFGLPTARPAAIRTPRCTIARTSPSCSDS